MSRRRRAAAPVLPVDRDVAALVVKVGNYPLHHGGVDAIRSLGRLGVPVYAVAEDRWTPAALSRYCRGRYVWPAEERADPKRMVERLKEAGREIPGPALLIPTDEEAAVLIAENSAALAEWFLLPGVPASLPARLASKRGLYELCLEHDVPTPASSFPQTAADVAEFAATATFPVVAKNLEAWVRLRAPVVNGTTVIATAAELLALARGWGDEPSVILQEYIPPEQAEDWIVHLYRGAGGEPLMLFTGVKVRSWPPQAGMTACAYTVSNPELAALAARLCERVGYCGIADLDFRYDRRDGRYKLVDFNPRIGAQFRLFENGAGVDVVRALHLDLTGRQVPQASSPEGRRILVENVDLPARLAARLTRRRSGYRVPVPSGPVRTELAWLAADDPLPVAAMLARSAGPLAAHLRRTRRTRALRRETEATPRPPATALPRNSTPGQTAIGSTPAQTAVGSTPAQTAVGSTPAQTAVGQRGTAVAAIGHSQGR